MNFTAIVKNSEGKKSDLRLFFPDITCASIIGETVGNIESKSPVRLPRNGTWPDQIDQASFEPRVYQRRVGPNARVGTNSTVFVRGEDNCTRDQIFDNFLIALFSLLLNISAFEPEQKRWPISSCCQLAQPRNIFRYRLLRQNRSPGSS